MSEQEKQSWGKYEVGQQVKYKSGDGEVFEVQIINYNSETKYYTLRGVVRGEMRDIKVPKNLMYEKLVLPEEEKLKYPVGSWVTIYRNVYDSDGKKTGEKQKTRGFVNGIARGDGRYVILCPTSVYDQDTILVTEKTLDELNPKGGQKVDDVTLQIKTLRSTLQGGHDAPKK
jgi:hypothetical protein